MSYQRRSFKRREAQRDSSLIVIATEGSKTEKIYFQGLVSKQAFYSSRVRVEVVDRDCVANSSPSHVLETICKIQNKYELSEDDKLWIVIDKDQWSPRELSDVASKCEQKGIKMALSNPAFELWLLLHHENIQGNETAYKTCEEITQRLRAILGGYDKTNLQFEKFKEKIEDGINNSKLIDKNVDDRWPQNTGTRVYLLVEQILSFYKADRKSKGIE